MQLHSIGLTNFKSFRGSHSFPFQDKPSGLHFVTGRNITEPALGANGVGKSSLFDAVYFALFGKTIRGLKAGDVVSWGETDCRVRLTMTSGDRRFMVDRARKGTRNKLTIDGEEASQDMVDKAVGLPESLFAAALIRGQFSTMFFDLSPANQLAMMDDILELDIWTNASTRAKDEARRCENEATMAREDLARSEGAMEAHKTSLEEIKRAAADAKQAEVAAIAALEKQYDEAAAHLKQLKAREQKLTDASAKISTSELDAAEADVTKWTRDVDNAQRECNAMLTMLRENDALQEQWRKRISHFESLSSSATCPTCEQPVEAQHTSSCVAVAQKEIEAAGNDRKTLDAELTKSRARETEANDNQLECLKARDAVRNRMAEASREVDRAASDTQRAESELNAINARVEERAKRTNPYDEQIKSKEQSIEACREYQEGRTQQRDDFERLFKRAEYWIDGFKHVRLFVIDRALTALELEVNSNLVQLGLTDLIIKFATERETKSGSVTRRFDVVVANSATPEKTTPLAAWSGGEYQRLRLACELGLANMILGSRGITPKFEVWDEPTSHLSTQGIDSLMGCLRERGMALDRTIWMIDHTSVDFPFDSVTTIIKDADGSSIEAE